MTLLFEFLSVNGSFDEVAARVAAYFDAHPATGSSKSQLTLRAPIDGDAHVRHEIPVTVGDLPGHGAGRSFSVHWEAHFGGLYPSFDGALTIGEDSAKRSRLEVYGIYSAPTGVWGKHFDAERGRSTAESCARDLLGQLQAMLENPATGNLRR